MSNEIVAQTETDGTISVNFDIDSIDGKKRMFNALNTPESLDGSNVTIVELIGIVVSPEEKVDPATGEVSTVLKTVLMSTDGHDYFSNSFGIGRSALALIKACGGTIPEGCTVEVFETKLDAKRTMKQLRWI